MPKGHACFVIGCNVMMCLFNPFGGKEYCTCQQLLFAQMSRGRKPFLVAIARKVEKFHEPSSTIPTKKVYVRRVNSS